jgi:hypothetical protein|tara:strand:- start:623 stop:943 length:321 start_codon:yes stop_codon:yes gene_type:complete
MATPIKWEDANFTWDKSPTTGIPYTWDNVQLVEQAIEEIRQGASMDEVFYGEPDKKKRLINLICKIQGKTIKQSKEINDYKIKVSDIRLLAKEVLNIEVLTENIKF